MIINQSHSGDAVKATAHAWKVRRLLLIRKDIPNFDQFQVGQVTSSSTYLI